MYIPFITTPNNWWDNVYALGAETRDDVALSYIGRYGRICPYIPISGETQAVRQWISGLVDRNQYTAVGWANLGYSGRNPGGDETYPAAHSTYAAMRAVYEDLDEVLPSCICCPGQALEGGNATARASFLSNVDTMVSEMEDLNPDVIYMNGEMVSHPKDQYSAWSIAKGDVYDPVSACSQCGSTAQMLSDWEDLCDEVTAALRPCATSGSVLWYADFDYTSVKTDLEDWLSSWKQYVDTCAPKLIGDFPSTSVQGGAGLNNWQTIWNATKTHIPHLRNHLIWVNLPWDYGSDGYYATAADNIESFVETALQTGAFGGLGVYPGPSGRLVDGGHATTTDEWDAWFDIVEQIVAPMQNIIAGKIATTEAAASHTGLF